MIKMKVRPSIVKISSKGWLSPNIAIKSLFNCPELGAIRKIQPIVPMKDGMTKAIPAKARTNSFPGILVRETIQAMGSPSKRQPTGTTTPSIIEFISALNKSLRCMTST